MERIAIRELRIGNIIRLFGEEHIVTLETFRRLAVGEITASDFFGVPISYKKLIDFGFEQHEQYFTIKTGWYFLSGGTTKSQTKLRIKFTKANNFHVLGPANGSIYLKHIHQVQNLYFALCERELGDK
jgi:hypothetical protein